MYAADDFRRSEGGGNSARRPRVLHISADYPDTANPAKTNAIRSLVGLIGHDFRNQVISLNRASPGAGEFLAQALGLREVVRAVDHGSDVTSLTYAAPSKGLFHRSTLFWLARELLSLVCYRELPDLIIGYKLTVEGFLVCEIAKALGIPYAIVIQGNTDVRILRARPDLRLRCAAILEGASAVFAMTPWAHAAIERYLGPLRGPIRFLPCPVALDRFRVPVVGGQRLTSAFHLRNYQLKNFPRLVRATVLANRFEPDLGVDIIGGGDAPTTAKVRIIAGASPAISLTGEKDNALMGAALNASRGFVMPSLRESFGMVFIEALLSGCPIIYPQGRAVDGYLDGLPFAIRVDPTDTRAIAQAMLMLHRDEARLKRLLAEWQLSVGASRFRSDCIATTFRAGLMAALGAGSSPAWA